MIDGTNLFGPEFEIFDTSTDIARINFVNSLVYGSVSSTTTVDISGYVPLAANPDQLVTAVAAVMMHGQVSDNMRAPWSRRSPEFPITRGAPKRLSI